MKILITIIEVFLMTLWGAGIMAMMFFPLIDKIAERFEK